MTLSSNEKWTALHASAFRGHEHMTELLLKFGAEVLGSHFLVLQPFNRILQVDPYSDQGTSPLFYAAEKGHLAYACSCVLSICSSRLCADRCVKLLTCAGARVDGQTPKSWTPLQIAVWRYEPACALYLLNEWDKRVGRLTNCEDDERAGSSSSRAEGEGESEEGKTRSTADSSADAKAGESKPGSTEQVDRFVPLSKRPKPQSELNAVIASFGNMYLLQLVVGMSAWDEQKLDPFVTTLLDRHPVSAGALSEVGKSCGCAVFQWQELLDDGFDVNPVNTALYFTAEVNRTHLMREFVSFRFLLLLYLSCLSHQLARGAKTAPAMLEIAAKYGKKEAAEILAAHMGVACPEMRNETRPNHRNATPAPPPPPK